MWLEEARHKRTPKITYSHMWGTGSADNANRKPFWKPGAKQVLCGFFTQTKPLSALESADRAKSVAGKTGEETFQIQDAQMKRERRVTTRPPGQFLYGR